MPGRSLATRWYSAKYVADAESAAAGSTLSNSRRTITFAYSGDEAGQGWGINPEWGQLV